MAEVNIWGFLKVDLEKLVNFSREFLFYDKGTKQAIKEFIEVTENTYNSLVLSVTPFYKLLYDDKIFQANFSEIYKSFMDNFFGHGSGKIEANCTFVQTTLEDIKQSKIKKFPLLRKPIEKLEKSNFWILKDYTISNTIEYISTEFDTHLSEVSHLLARGQIEQARNQLQIFMNEVKNNFEKFKPLLKELRTIKMKL